jgi:hypothetical protein
MFFSFLLINNVHAQNLQKPYEFEPISGFEENKGQIIGPDSKRVKFIFKDKNLAVFLLDDGIAYQFMKRNPSNTNHLQTETYRLDIKLEGVNKDSEISTAFPTGAKNHYYLANATDINSYKKVIYRNIYPKIDWVIYVKNGFIKYDFIVYPGGNPKQIILKAEWADEIKIDHYRNLILQTKLGTIRENKPISFQGEEQIDTDFILENNTIRFSVGDYNTGRPLIIDPDIVWSTYYGGSSTDEARCTTTDQSGNVYLAGLTYSTNNIYSGGYQTSISGGQEAYVVKFNANGVRQWATYIGGPSNDVINSCTTDAQGNVFIAGNTESASGIASGGFQNTHGGLSYTDAFLIKLNSNGDRLWGTYYGGSQRDFGNSCATDASGNVYLAGYTESETGISFGGFQANYGSFTDAFLVKFTANGERVWATYYGGENFDSGESCTTDANGNVYLSGYTQSTAGIAANGHQMTFGGVGDAFVAKFGANGARIWGTYYGGSTIDVGKSCVIDRDGNVYLSGSASSTSAIAVNGHQNSYGGGVYDAFLVKFNSDCIRQWATYYGGSDYDFCHSSCIDASGNIYLAGYTKSASNIAAGGYQNTHGGTLLHDAFLVKFNGNGIRQWGTYAGGPQEDMAYSCIADFSGNVFIAGRTDNDAGISRLGHQNIFGGVSDGFLTKFADVVTSIPNSDDDFNMYIYPNPFVSESLLDIQTKTLTGIEIKIYNSIGVLLRQQSYPNSNRIQYRIHLSGYSSGIYWVEVKTKSVRKVFPIIKK